MKRLIAVLLAVVLVLAAAPVAFADDGVTVSGKYIFANGNAIVIKAVEEHPEVANIYLASAPNDPLTLTGLTEKNGGYDLSGCIIFGGRDGRNDKVTVANTSITMESGEVGRLVAGNYGMEDDSTAGNCSRVTGDARVVVEGGKVEGIVLGYRNSAVDGTGTIQVMDGAITWIEGGILGNGNEGTIDITKQEVTTHAVVNKTVIEVSGGKVTEFLAAGGQGYTKVNSSSVTITNAEVTDLYAGGINGQVGSSTVMLGKGARITGLQATNRGYLGTSVVTIDGATVTKLYTGATPGAFDSDDDKASAVTESITWIIESGKVENAYVTPTVNREDDAGNYGFALGNMKIINSTDTEIAFSVQEYEAKTGAIETNKFDVGEEDDVVFQGPVKVTVQNGNTVTNSGNIQVTGGATLVNEGSMSVENGGVLDIGQNGTVQADTTNPITLAVGGKIKAAHGSVVGGLNVRPEGGTATTIEPGKEYTLNAAGGELEGTPLPQQPEPDDDDDTVTSDDGAKKDEYNYWEDLRTRIESADKGKTITSDAGSYDRMPYDVMLALYEHGGVTLKLSWDGGKDIVIAAGKALEPEAGRGYYPLAMLAGQFGTEGGSQQEANPETGSVAHTGAALVLAGVALAAACVASRKRSR